MPDSNDSGAVDSGRPVLFLAAAAVLAAAAFFSLRGSSAPPPGVLLVTIDTLRRDAVTAGDMPYLHGLMERGTRFLHARTPIPLTLPAHVSLLTGLLPPRHGIRDNASPPLPPADKRPYTLLAEEFREAGYATAAFVAAAVLSPRYGLDSGFQRYDRPAEQQRGDPVFRYLNAKEQVARFDTWWRARRTDKPFFAWVHLFDPHDPYLPYEGDARRAATGPQDSAEMRYRGEARRADAALEAICSRIDFANTIVVVCSDHGESLGEHGEVTHGYLCYGATLDVPLVLVGPDVPAGEIDARPCSLVDVAPTLRTLCDLPPRQGDGIDLLGLALPELEAYRAVVSESLYAYRLYGWAQQTAAYDGHVSLVDGGPRFELFELSRDPGEERPLEGARATQLDEALLGYRAASVGGAGGALVGVQTPYGSARMQRTAFLPPAENRKLRDVREALPDVAVLNEVRRLIAARRPGLLMQHLPNLELFAAEDASNPAPCLELARAYRMLGDLKQAAEAARMAYERGYDVPDVHKLLLVVLIQAKRMEDARAWFTKHGHRLTPEDRAQFAEALGD